MSGLIQASSLFARSGYNYINFAAPAAAEMSPPQYAGKIETLSWTMALDVLDTPMADIPNTREFANYLTGYNLFLRTCDDLVDEKSFADQEITVEQLIGSKTHHKFSKESVTANDGLEIATDAIGKLISGNNIGAKRRRTHVIDTLIDYAGSVTDNANNPQYHGGPVLNYETAMQSRYDVTAKLGEITVSIFAALLDKPEDKKGEKLFGQIGMAIQFGDDLYDWRKDWKDHIAKQQSGRPVKSQENLFNSVLHENPQEEEVCLALLDDKVRSAVLARKHSPNSYGEFYDRFDDLLSQWQPHRYTKTGKQIMQFLVRKVVPNAPESGRFYDWAKV